HPGRVPDPTPPRTPFPPPPLPEVVGARERTVHVVTHPEATHHVEGLVGGVHDSDLTARGARQAALVAAALRARIPHDAAVDVVTPDLPRTRRTATALGEALGVVPSPDTRLRDASYGAAGGRPQAWL